MDRSERYGSFEREHEIRGGAESEYYRQTFGEQGRSANEGDSPEWGYIAAGALMLGLGTYLMYLGSRDRHIPMPRLGQGSESSFRRGSEGQARRAAAGMMKGRSESQGVQVRQQVTVNRPVGELYRFWRNVENLPRVMTYLEDVKSLGDRRSHWVAKGPAGQRIEWDAEVTDARENELVAWRSIEGSEVPNEGSVRFTRSTDGNGTVIDVALTYHPPGGKAGAAVAKLFGREPAQEIRRDLDHFKERVESGNLILSSGTGGTFSGS